MPRIELIRWLRGKDADYRSVRTLFTANSSCIARMPHKWVLGIRWRLAQDLSGAGSFLLTLIYAWRILFPPCPHPPTDFWSLSLIDGINAPCRAYPLHSWPPSLQCNGIDELKDLARKVLSGEHDSGSESDDETLDVDGGWVATPCAKLCYCVYCFNCFCTSQQTPCFCRPSARVSLRSESYGWSYFVSCSTVECCVALLAAR